MGSPPTRSPSRACSTRVGTSACSIARMISSPVSDTTTAWCRSASTTAAWWIYWGDWGGCATPRISSRACHSRRVTTIGRACSTPTSFTMRWIRGARHWAMWCAIASLLTSSSDDPSASYSTGRCYLWTMWPKRQCTAPFHALISFSHFLCAWPCKKDAQLGLWSSDGGQRLYSNGFFSRSARRRAGAAARQILLVLPPTAPRPKRMTVAASIMEPQPLDPPDISLENLLRPMLPPGAPIPDYDQLDYSFAIEYSGPVGDHPVPRADPLVGSRDSSSQVDSSSVSKTPRPKPSALHIDTRKRAHLAAEKLISESGSARSPITGLVEKDSSSTTGRSPLSNSGTRGKAASKEKEAGSSSPDSRLAYSGLNSLSRKSSSSEIEELNVQFSAAVSAAASALPSPSALRSVSLSENHNLENSDFHSTPRSISMPERDRADGSSRPGSPSGVTAVEPVVVVTKKRECHRCLKKHMLQEKETCLVCTARYCRNCVLIAMGSMPEGRKCLRCIGLPIHESRRPYLGKPSRLLKSILSPLEIQQIMRTEKDCLANQLRPEQLIVNGRALAAPEMSELLSCSNPPPKLKPGKYWYDKTSGLWGKEGEKPSKIVTAELKVGGNLKPDASLGTTEVYINCRQITKSELKMLKLAGVQCPPSTYLFLSPDGSYMEEGQNNYKGNIWEKASIRVMYSLFSLPTPRGSVRANKPSARELSARYPPAILEHKNVSKLLLLGHEGSGRSTIFKQAKFLYRGGFEQKELERYKEMIQTYIYKYLVILLEGRERFEDEEGDALLKIKCDPPATGETSKNMYSMDTRLKNLADWFLDITADGSLERYFPAATREYAASVEELWRDPAIQATFKRKEELHKLPDVAGEFLERVVELSSNEYEPVDHDILYAEGLTQGSGLAEIEFGLPDREQTSGAMHDTVDYSPTGRYQLIRVGGIGLKEGKKWLGMFEDVRAVVFTVALSEFDQLWIDSDGVARNKLLISKELFQDIVARPCFKGTPFILFLNKYDKFEEKIMKGVPLTTCDWFSDFSPVGVPHSTQAQQAYTYVVHKFKKLVGDRKLYTFQLNALERNLVASAFQYVKHILKHEESKAAGWMALPEDSSYCTDLSSYSLHSARQENGNSWDRSARYGTYVS
ncbi:extra-large guanine nucleotide-binding protein 3 isoform X1 [Selaginella moellendorffii]|nr:extra-large guanine nucleotide-binding protein 3 isoform X1 [Selaginella moellendorffii]|eukprot:XP_002964129.2 extra-large guanine nucleotide-binding protein 3 isoform X1 [Selaginella moellendorffii]